MKKHLLSVSLRVFGSVLVFMAFIATSQAQTLKTATGGPNTFNLSLGQNLGGSYPAGLSFTFISNQTLTTGGATLNVNGTGIIPLVKNVNQPLVANDILAGQAVQVLYDGTNFQVLNVGSGSLSPSSIGGSGFDPYNYVNIVQELPPVTGGGSVPANNTWFTRPLNLEKNDLGNLASLTANQITLLPGTYYTKAISSGNYVGDFQLRLRNITDNTTILVGGVSYTPLASDKDFAELQGMFTISTTKIIELQLIVNDSHGTTYEIGGYANNFGENNIAAQIEFFRQGSSSGGTNSGTTSGISTLNGLTTTSQNFSTSSTGTSVNIISVGNTHNFNIPLASVVGGNNVTVTGVFPTFTISGTSALAPTLSLVGNNLSIGGGNFVTLPIVSITGLGTVSVSGTYPNFTITGLSNTSTTASTGQISAFEATNGTSASSSQLTINTTLTPPISFNNNLNYSPGVLTISTPGIYLLAASVEAQGTGLNGNYFQAQIRKNGSPIIFGSIEGNCTSGCGSTYFTSVAVGVVTLSPGDLITLQSRSSTSVTYTNSNFSGFMLNGGGTLTVSSFIGGTSTTGISSLNGLTTSSQSFTTSSTGTSVNIISSGNTHNINIPLASVVGGNNITVTGSFPLYTLSGLASTATSQWVTTTGGIYYNGGDVTHYGKIIGVSAANPHIYLDNPSIATGAGTEIAINSNAGGTSKYFAVGVNNGGRNFYIFPQGGGSDAVNIDFSGNVGIGVASGSSIGAKLDVNGNARIAGLMTISSFSNGGTQSLGVDNNGQLVTVTGGSSQWLNSSVSGIYYPSRVGIGSPVPGSNLEIAGSPGLTALKVTPGASGFAGIDFTLNNTYFNISGTRSSAGALNRFSNSGSATTLDVQNTGGGNAASFTGNITVTGLGGFNGVQTPTITLSGLATGGSPQTLGVNNIGQLVTISGSNNLWIDYGLGGIAYTIAGTDLKIQPGYLTYFNANSTANLGSLFSIQGTAGQYAYSQISLQNDYQRNTTTPLAWDFQHNIDHSFRIIENTNNAFNERLVILPNSGNVGIGTSSPATLLDVNGNARFTGPVTITSFAGAGTQALGVNNLGQLVTIAGATPTTATGFSVNSSVNLILASGITPTIINFNIRNYDKATAFNLLTDKYIVPIAGEYFFTAKALTNNIGEVDISIFVNDILVEEVRTSPDPSTGLYNTAAITALLNLAANDSVDVRIAQTTGSNQTLYSNGGTTIKFSGKRVGD